MPRPPRQKPSSVTRNTWGGELRHEIRRPGRQPGLPEHIAGFYHAGSVGIIMSGWLGGVNYGVIVANDVDAFLTKK